MRELHAVLDAAAHVGVREIDLAPAHVALGVLAVAHTRLAPERELRRRIAGEHAAKNALDGPRERQRLGVELAERGSQELEEALGALLRCRADREHALVREEQRRRAV